MITPQNHLRIHGFLPNSYTNGPGCRAVLWVQGCTLACAGCFNPDSHSLNGGELVLLEETFRRIVTLGSKIEGITISGGEPLQQLSSITGLLRRIREETGFSVLLFTGYTWEEIQHIQNPNQVSGENPSREMRIKTAHSLEGCNSLGAPDLTSSPHGSSEGVGFRAGTFGKIENMTSDSKRRWSCRPEILEYVDVVLAGRYRAGRRAKKGLLGSSGKSVHFLTNRYCADDLENVPPAEVILSSSGDASISGIDPLVWKS